MRKGVVFFWGGGRQGESFTSPSLLLFKRTPLPFRLFSFSISCSLRFASLYAGAWRVREFFFLLRRERKGKEKKRGLGRLGGEERVVGGFVYIKFL